MSRDNAPLTPQSILDLSIQACARQIRWRDLLRRVIVCLCGGLLFALLLVVADHTWPHGLPRRVAIGASLTGVGLVVALLLVCGLLLLFRRLNPLFAARQIEQSLGVAHNTLINALLLRNQPDAAPVVQAATQRAAHDLGDHAHVHVNTGGSRRTGILLSVTCGLWLVYALLSPKSVLQSLQRLFGAPIAAPTVTQLHLIEPGANAVVYAGDPLRVRVGLSGRTPDEVTFEFRPMDRPEAATRYAMTADAQLGGDERQVVLSPHEVTGDLAFTCQAGDARLVGVIRVQAQPDVLGYEIRLAPPAYTGEPERTVRDPELIVWPGTEAVFDVTSNVDARNPVFVFETDVESRARMRADAVSQRRMTTSRRLMQEGRYRVEFADEWGYAIRHPRWHRVTLRRDMPPEVQIVSPLLAPGGEPTVDLAEVGELAAEVSDDVHVASAELVVESAGGPQRTSGLPASDELRRRAVARVPAENISLSAAEQARAWFEVRDNRVLPDGVASPQTTRSRVFTLMRSAEPPPPAFQPEQTDGQPGNDSPRSGDDSMDEEIPGSGQAGRPGEKGDTGEPPGGQPDEAGEPDSSTEQQPSDAESQQGRPEDNAERQAQRERFVQEHEQELRQIGEAMAEQSAEREKQQAGERAEEQQADKNDRGDESSDQTDDQKQSSDQDGMKKGERAAESETKNEDQKQEERPARPGEEPRQPPGQRPDPPPAEGQPRSTSQGEPNPNHEPPQVATPPGDQPSEEQQSQKREAGQAESPENPPEPSANEKAQGGNQSGGPEAKKGDEPSRDGQAGQAPPNNGAGQSSEGQSRPADKPGENKQAGDGSTGDKPGEQGSQGEGSPPRSPEPSGKQSQSNGEQPSADPQEDGKVKPGTVGQSGEPGPDEAKGSPDKPGPKQAATPESPAREGPEQSAGQETPPDEENSKAKPGAGQAKEAGEEAPERSGGAEDRPGEEGELPPAPPLDGPGKIESPPPPDRRTAGGDGKPGPDDVLKRLERAGGITPELEDELHWPEEKAARFGRELERLLNRDRTAGPNGNPAHRRVNVDVGSDEVQAGRGVAGDASLRGEEVESRDDSLGKIAPPPDQRVSPELRAMLDAYYRAMAQRAAEKRP
jgi:hypothetical protein